MNKEEYHLFTTELRKLLSEEDAMFIQGLIKLDKKDENLMSISNIAIKQMVGRNIFDAFHKVCENLGIIWIPSNNY